MADTPPLTIQALQARLAEINGRLAGLERVVAAVGASGRPIPYEVATPGPMKPVQRLGGTVVLLGPQGLLSVNQNAGGIRTGGTGAPQVYQVVGREPLAPLGTHGFIPLYLNGPLMALGYGGTYGGEIVNQAIAAGGSIEVTPQGLSLFPGVLSQLRWRPTFIGAFPTGVALSDLDFTLSHPGGMGDWILAGSLQGVVNARFFPPLSGDATVQPAQGADIFVPSTNFPYASVRDWIEDAWWTEFCTWTNQPPQFQITNQSATAIAVAAPTSLVVGMNAVGFRYNLAPYIGPGVPIVVGGRVFEAPPDTVIVPIAATPPGTN